MLIAIAIANISKLQKKNLLIVGICNKTFILFFLFIAN